MEWPNGGVPDHLYKYTMAYHDSDEKDLAWKLVSESDDDRIERVLQWCFDRVVTLNADDRIVVHEADAFYVERECLTFTPVWQYEIDLFDVVAQQKCTVCFQLK